MLMHRNSSISMARRGSEGGRVLQPRSASFIGSLPVDGFSLNRLKFSSLGLYGRDKETLHLWEAYSKVESTGTKGLVMISGYTGTGKSAIVKKFQNQLQRDHLSKKKCFFAAGKFDLHNRGEPYTALISAFTKLGEDILSLKGDNSDQFDRIRNSILEAVGSEGEVLSNVIPNITEILGSDPSLSSCEDKYEESARAKNRFNFILRQFLRALCTQVQPIVLFIDDLQWADIASLDVVDTLMTDSQLSGMLLVGCYRENEVHESHPLAVRLRGFQRDSNPQSGELDLDISIIHVGNLDIDTVHDFVTDLLNISNKSKTLALARSVHDKTLGNVFFMIQFLKTLLDEDMLVYSLGAQSWKWDDEEIRCSTRVADNVVELLQTKMRQHVARPVVKILQLASCLGGTFDKTSLVLVAKILWQGDNDLWAELDGTHPTEVKSRDNLPALTLDECLSSCVNEGFLEVAKETSTSFSFSHDQIQSAAYSMIPEEKRNLFQLRIGEVLVEHLSEGELENMLFVAVDLLNKGLDHIESGEKRVSFACLNLRAGKKATESLAFTSASSYLATGLQLLGPNRWVTHHDLSLDMINMAMNAEFCKGNFEKVYQYADEVIKQKDSPIQDKITAYSFRMECIFYHGRPVEALDLCLDLMAQLGEPLQLPFGKASIMWEFLKMKKVMKKHPLSTLCDLPILEDKLKLQMMKMMLKCGIFAFAAKPELFPLLVLKSVQWTVRYGVSKYSPPFFTGFGLMAVSVFGNFKEADEFGKYALSLVDRLKAKETQSVTLLTYNSCIRHWVRPLQLSRKESFKAYELGLQTGDPMRALTNISHFCTVCYITGEPLSQLEADLRKYCKQMEEYEQGLMLRVASITRQSVLNLLSQSDDPVVLTGEAMNQDEFLKHCAENGRTQLLDIMRVFQLQLAFLFDRYDLASKLVDETQNVAKTNPANIVVWRNAGFDGLAAIALARKGIKRRKWKNHAMKVIKKVRKWVSNGHVNCLHTLYLLEAEMYALDGKTDEAKQNYDLAISTAGRAGFRVDKAVSYERAGEFFLEHGDVHWAGYYLSLSYEQYVEWEARAKADHLYEKYSALISESTLRRAGIEENQE